MEVLISFEVVIRVALVMSEEHYADELVVDFVKDVIRKSSQVCSAKLMFGRMEVVGHTGRLRDYGSKFSFKFISQPRGDFGVIFKSLDEVALDEGMVNYLHDARSRAMSAQNSSAEIG